MKITLWYDQLTAHLDTGKCNHFITTAGQRQDREKENTTERWEHDIQPIARRWLALFCGYKDVAMNAVSSTGSTIYIIIPFFVNPYLILMFKFKAKAILIRKSTCHTQ